MNIHISNAGQSLIPLGEPKTYEDMVARYKARRARWAAMDAAEARKQRSIDEAEENGLAVIFGACLEMLRLAAVERVKKERALALMRDPAPIRARRILNDVAKRTGISADLITGPIRRGDIMKARFEAVYEVAKSTQWSLPRLGRFFNRDHSTMIHALRRETARRAAESPSNV